MGLVLPTTAVNADGVEYTKAWVLNWDKVANAAWFSVPKLMPVKLVFDWRAIIPVLIMFVVTAVETVGDISGVMEGGNNKQKLPTKNFPAVSSVMELVLRLQHFLVFCRILLSVRM